MTNSMVFAVYRFIFIKNLFLGAHRSSALQAALWDWGRVVVCIPILIVILKFAILHI